VNPKSIKQLAAVSLLSLCAGVAQGGRDQGKWNRRATQLKKRSPRANIRPVSYLHVDLLVELRRT